MITLHHYMITSIALENHSIILIHRQQVQILPEAPITI